MVDVFEKERKKAEAAGIYEFHKAFDKAVRGIEDAASLIESNDNLREYLEEIYGDIEYADKFMMAYIAIYLDYNKDGSVHEALEKYYTSY